MSALITAQSDTRLSSPGDIFYEHFEPNYNYPVTIASGQNLLKGSPLGKQTANGKYYLLDLTASDGTQNLAGFLGEAVDATSADVKSFLWVHGVFNLSMLPNIQNYATSPLTAGYYNSGTIVIKEAE